MPGIRHRTTGYTSPGFARISFAAIVLASTGGVATQTPAHATIPLASCQSSWANVATASSGGTATSFNAVVGSAPNDVWAIGDAQQGTARTLQTLSEHFDGTNWNVVPTPNAGTGDNGIGAAAELSPGNVWAVGDYFPTTASTTANTLVEHWNGTSWSVVASPNAGSSSNVLFGVAGTSSNDVWAVGFYVAAIGTNFVAQNLIEHWNGSAWSVVSSPNSPGSTGSNFLDAVTATSTTDVWAVGAFKATPSTAYATLVEHWNGSTWSIVSSPASAPGTTGDNFLNGVAVNAATDVYAVGSADVMPTTPTTTQTLAMHWNGSAWSIVPSQNVTTTDDFLSAVSASGGSIWAVGASKPTTNFQPLTEKWNGSSFASVSNPNPSSTSDNQLNAVGTVSPNDVWAVGTSGSAQMAQNYCVPPAVSSIAPQSGSGAGGTSVTITGTGFLGAIGVNFGASPAASFTVVSDTQITAVSPPQAAGTVDVTVSSAATSATSASDQFTYTAVFPGQYTPLPPFRILDTRNGNGGFSTLGPGQSIDVQVAGVPQSGVPAMSSATPPSAVVLNVTVTNPTAAGYLTLYPTGVIRPLASNLNFVPGQTVPNLVEVALGVGGKVTVYNSTGSSDVVFDVAGWVSTQGTVTGTAGLFRPLVPARLLDTRTGQGVSHTLSAGQTINLQVTGAGQVPTTGVSGVVLNVTATGPTAPSFLTVFPAGATQPLASNVNFASGQTVPNRVMVKLSTSGAVSIFNAAGSVDVVVDVGGWFTDGSDTTATGGLFTGLNPARILDTRNGNGGFTSPVGPGGTIRVQVAGQGGVPATGAKAVVLNVTATNTTAPSFLTVFPSDATTQPLASDLNWIAGKTVPNLVVVKLGADGKVAVYNGAGSTDVVFDIVGWYG